MASGVYKITNIVNTRFYIGSATNIQKRWQGHIQDLNRGVHANSHFQKAWNKYGELCFSFEVLEHCSKAEIIEREQHYLDSLTACSRGYNICPIAYSRLGTKMPINAVERIRQANKGRVPTLEARLKMSIASKGKPKFPEMRQKLSEYHKGLKASDETKMKMSIARRKRITTDETRKNLLLLYQKGLCRLCRQKED